MARFIGGLLGGLLGVVWLATPAAAQVRVDIGVMTPNGGGRVVVGPPPVYVVDPYYGRVYRPYTRFPPGRALGRRAREYRRDIREARREFERDRRDAEREYWRDMRDAQRDYERARRDARRDRRW